MTARPEAGSLPSAVGMARPPPPPDEEPVAARPQPEHALAAGRTAPGMVTAAVGEVLDRAFDGRNQGSTKIRGVKVADIDG